MSFHYAEAEKVRIAASLGCDRKDAEVQELIEGLVSYLLAERRRQAEAPAPSQIRKHIHRVKHLAKTLLKDMEKSGTPRYLKKHSVALSDALAGMPRGPRQSRAASDWAIYYLGFDIDIQALRDGLARLPERSAGLDGHLQQLHKEASRWESLHLPEGRPNDDAFDFVVPRLADLYKDVTREEADVPWAASDGRFHGRFFGFVQACLEPAARRFAVGHVALDRVVARILKDPS